MRRAGAAAAAVLVFASFAAPSVADEVGSAAGGPVIELQNDNAATGPDHSYTYGTLGDRIVFGDWDGNGTHTPGVVRGREVHLRNTNSGGVADISYVYGRTGDRIVFGDWDGNGTHTPGVVRGREVHLRNTNSGGVADISYVFGRTGDRIVFGDWDGNGTHTPAAVRGRIVFLRNSNSGGVADRSYAYGTASDTLTFGDWDGNGTHTPAVLRPTAVLARNSNASGIADLTIPHDVSARRIVLGDWDGDGDHTLGFVGPSGADTGPSAGVVVSPSGVVTPVLETRQGAWVVQTPCGAPALLAGGTLVNDVDVLIDPGHGGAEGGSTGANGLIEKNLNLAVAQRLGDLLRAEGLSVLLTRNFDHRLPIESRTDIANALKPDVFLSVHHNGGAIVASSTPGTEVFAQHDLAESRRLGGILYQELVEAAAAFPTSWVATVRAGVSSRLNASGGDFYGIHRRTPDIISVITEFLYLSNPAEAALLALGAVQQAEAQALADGIMRWYETADIGAGYLPDFVDTTDNGAGGFQNCVDPALQ